VDSTTLDFTSILRFVEDNWGLEPMASRDAAANSIVSAFDFEQPPREPAFISFERTPPEGRQEPRRDVLYIAYSIALVLGLVPTLLAVVTSRRNARRSSREAPDATS